MKTPMQEHIEWMQEKLRILVEYKDLSAGAEVDECIQHAEAMLEKEKEFFKQSFHNGFTWCCEREFTDEVFKDYNETFNTEEK